MFSSIPPFADMDSLPPPFAVKSLTVSERPGLAFRTSAMLYWFSTAKKWNCLLLTGSSFFSKSIENLSPLQVFANLIQRNHTLQLCSCKSLGDLSHYLGQHWLWWCLWERVKIGRKDREKESGQREKGSCVPGCYLCSFSAMVSATCAPYSQRKLQQLRPCTSGAGISQTSDSQSSIPSAIHNGPSQNSSAVALMYNYYKY